MAFDLRIDIEDQQPFELDLSTKRVSAKCLKLTKKIHIGRLYLIAICCILIIIPILYLIPCSDARLRFTVNQNAFYTPFTVNSFSISNDQYENLSITPDIDWDIQYIEVGFNPFIYTIKNNVMLRHLVYHDYITDLGIDTVRLNSLRVRVFESKNEYWKIGNTSFDINGLDIIHTIPTDYVLSYIKIVVSGINDNQFEVEFYHFFYEDTKTDLKYGMTTQIIINNLQFNSTSYAEWYNWKYLNGTTVPNGYPYEIGVNVRRYNMITDALGVYSV